MKKIRVLIVDDSAVVRSVLTEILSFEESIDVIGEAVDPFDARDKIKKLKPDVLTLDIEMPKMDGITFLRNIMKLNPMPVIMISTLTHAGASVTLQALEIGAIDFIAKPKATAIDAELRAFQQDLVNKIKAAAQTQKKLKLKRPMTGVPKPIPHQLIFNRVHSYQSIIAIGASTGGTEALRDLLLALPENLPPIVVTQHIPASFSGRFATRLNEQVTLAVREAKEGDVLRQGTVYITPGSHHMVVKKHGHQLICHLDDSALVNRHRPSVEVMFNSIRDLSLSNVTAIMLTGMGEDGAKAMKELADAGAHTIVQDEASSLIWGMPGAAVKYGVVSEIVALNQIASRLIQHLSAEVKLKETI